MRVGRLAQAFCLVSQSLAGQLVRKCNEYVEMTELLTRRAYYRSTEKQNDCTLVALRAYSLCILNWLFKLRSPRARAQLVTEV
jgi:hypothetical protein